MNIAGRALGTAIIYLATAIIAEVIVEAGLILTNGAGLPIVFWVVLFVVSPLVGFVIAGRYWSESEFIPGRARSTPLLCIVLLVAVLAVSSFFLGRPTSTIGQSPPLPQVSPSALPALPPVQTHDLHTSSGKV